MGSFILSLRLGHVSGVLRCHSSSQLSVCLSLSGPVMMMVLLLLLGGLVVCSRSEVAPPTVNISLDEHPEVRWAPLTKVFDVDYLQKAAAEVIE